MTLSAQQLTPQSRVQPQIEARRIVLRPIADADAPSLTRFAGDQRVAEGTRSIPHPLPETAVAQFITAALENEREEDVWVIDGSPSGAPSFLGVISLKALDRSQSQIGYWIAPVFWRDGYASEAVRALLDANPHRNRTIFAEVFKDNPASARILSNMGFEYISDAEAWSVARDQAVPTWTYLLRMA